MNLPAATLSIIPEINVVDLVIGKPNRIVMPVSDRVMRVPDSGHTPPRWSDEWEEIRSDGMFSISSVVIPKHFHAISLNGDFAAGGGDLRIWIIDARS